MSSDVSWRNLRFWSVAYHHIRCNESIMLVLHHRGSLPCFVARTSSQQGVRSTQRLECTHVMLAHLLDLWVRLYRLPNLNVILAISKAESTSSGEIPVLSRNCLKTSRLDTPLGHVKPLRTTDMVYVWTTAVLLWPTALLLRAWAQLCGDKSTSFGMINNARDKYQFAFVIWRECLCPADPEQHMG